MAKYGVCDLCGKAQASVRFRDKPLFHKRLKKHFYNIVICTKCLKEARKPVGED